jgi:hypothetical protein
MITLAVLHPSVEALDAELVRIYGEGLNSEQVACLTDLDRLDEALDMIDDMECRMGVRGHVRGDVAHWLIDRAIADEGERFV